MFDGPARIRAAAAALTRALPPFRGKTRAVRAFDRVVPASVNLFTHRSGARFQLGQALDIAERDMLYNSDYAPEVRALLRSLLAEFGWVCWDVGANIGSVGLPLLAECPSMEGHFFEPSPAVLARLVTNVSLNPQLARRCHTYGVALTNTTGLVSFLPSSERGNNGLGGLGPSGNRVDNGVQLYATSGDDLIERGVSAPNVIKIDVEGFEYEVLGGLEQLMKSMCPLAIVFEHCLYRFDERQMPRDFVIRFLQKYGFDVFTSDGGRVGRPVEAADLDRNSDWVALRR